MENSVKLIPAAALVSSTWSGGTTTELAIYPEGAAYGRRDFQWRLSSATVDCPQSTFTSLPGIRRQLLLLRGEMILTHAGHHRVTLRPGEQDQFDGGWTTDCQGTGQDFNLMLAAGWHGELNWCELIAGERQRMSLSVGFLAVYCVAGAVSWQQPGRSLELQPGDLLLVEATADERSTVLVATTAPAKFVSAGIRQMVKLEAGV